MAWTLTSPSSPAPARPAPHNPPPLALEYCRPGTLDAGYWAGETDYAAAASSFLDHLETKQQRPSIPEIRLLPNIPDDPATWKHGTDQTLRARHRRALEAAGVSEKRLESFDSCGKNPWVYLDSQDHGTPVLLGSACRDRFCPTCQRSRAYTIRLNLANIPARYARRFLTLTIRSSCEPLGEQLDRLYASFTELRRLKFWKKNVIGGVAFTEIKQNRSGAGWHVHLHCIVEGDYLEKSALVACWKAVTEDSYMVDVQLIRDQASIDSYITKYLTKPIPTDVLDYPSKAAEVIHALKGRRLSMTFGSFRGYKLTETPQRTGLIPVMPLYGLLNLARNGDPIATLIINDLHSRHHIHRTYAPGQHQGLDSAEEHGERYHHEDPPPFA